MIPMIPALKPAPLPHRVCDAHRVERIGKSLMADRRRPAAQAREHARRNP